MGKVIYKIFFLVIVAGLTISSILYYTDIKNFLQRGQPVIEKIQETVGGLANFKIPIEKLILPPPLRSTSDAPISKLTKIGVFDWTNRYRANESLQVLKTNLTLDQVANKKLADMFAKQYFEHVNPDGIGVGDLVKESGYAFIVVGENLALGNFKDDKDLVDAWMASPGHRANILNSKFQEIGIAVGRGVFEGKTTWLAVQTFAIPASACPLPDKKLSNQIEIIKLTTQELEKKLESLRIGIDSLTNERDILHQAAEKLISDGNNLINLGNEKIKEGNRVYKQTGSREQAESYWQEGENLQQQGQEKINTGLSYQIKIKDYTVQIQDKINEYNDAVSKIKSFNAGLGQLILQYNNQVEAYNNCVQSFS